MSEQDLKNMGLIDNGDGTYSKRKTIKQPREKIYPPNLTLKKVEKAVREVLTPQNISQRVEIKPLSVNAAWCGFRTKTEDYKEYERGVLSMLQERFSIPAPPYKLSILLGLSTRNGDIDNPVKLFIDILQKKYQFNDKEIYELSVKKIIVPKRKEYCEFKLEHLEDE